jgi:hypothetical protein
MKPLALLSSSTSALVRVHTDSTSNDAMSTRRPRRQHTVVVIARPGVVRGDVAFKPLHGGAHAL